MQDMLCIRLVATIHYLENSYSKRRKKGDLYFDYLPKENGGKIRH